LYLYGDYTGSTVEFKTIQIYCTGADPGSSAGYSGAITADGLTASLPFTGNEYEFSVISGEEPFFAGYSCSVLADWSPSTTPLSDFTYPVCIIGGPYPTFITGAWGVNTQEISTDWVNRVTWTNAMLLIPFDDANSVFYGTAAKTTFDYRYRDTHTGKSLLTRVTSNYLDNGVFYSNGQRTWDAVGVSGGTHETEQSSDGSFTDNTTARLLVSNAVETIDVAGQGAAYFTPEIGVTGNPYINPSNVMSSLGGSYKYTLTFSETGSGDWPSGAYNPIGWV
jgi:hypothetical protein